MRSTRQEHRQADGRRAILFVPIFAFVALLAVPLQWPYLVVIGAMLVAMAVGFLDDRKRGGWSEYALGACDLVLSVVAAMAVCHWTPFDVWLPFVKAPLHERAVVFVDGRCGADLGHDQFDERDRRRRWAVRQPVCDGARVPRRDPLRHRRAPGDLGVPAGAALRRPARPGRCSRSRWSAASRAISGTTATRASC